MLGNVKPHLPQLSADAKNKYNSMYCGLCKTLGRQNGILSRFMLNYDLVLVAMIYDELNEIPQEIKHTGCYANPFKKKDILQPTAGTAYAADVLVLLAYFKVVDNLYDEGFFKKLMSILVLPYIWYKYRKAAKRYPQLAQIFKAESGKQLTAEKENKDIDSLAMPTANMVRAVMAGCRDNLQLKMFGFFLGRVIYLMDALTDMEEDGKKGRFNVFNRDGYTLEMAKEECFMSLGEMANAYSQLPLENIKEITDNIIYMSLARQIKFAGQEKENTDG